MEEYREEIIKAKKDNKYAYGKAFNYLKAAKIIHDEIEESNKRMVDFTGVNKETESLLEDIFSREKTRLIKSGFKERHLFSAALTPDGYVDYTSSILESLSRVYYIRGQIGTGKSTILRRLVEEAKTKNYHIEIYHDPLIPDKIQSVLIKELDTIVTSNENGESFAQVKVDLDEYFDNSNLREEDYEMFNLLVQRGIKSLSGAKNNHFILEESYKPSIDYKKVSEAREMIYREILEIKDRRNK